MWLWLRIVGGPVVFSTGRGRLIGPWSLFGGGLLIHRQHDRIVTDCDACDRTFEGNSDELINVWPQAKREGWQVRKVGKDWCQFCGSDDQSGTGIECFSHSLDLGQRSDFARGAEWDVARVPTTAGRCSPVSQSGSAP